MAVTPTHTAVKRGRDGEQIPEVASIIERAAAAGLSTMEDVSGTTPYATTGVTVFQPDKRPPATLVVHFLKTPAHEVFTLWFAVVYAAGSKAPGYPASDPDEAAALIDEFLETYRCPTT